MLWVLMVVWLHRNWLMLYFVAMWWRVVIMVGIAVVWVMVPPVTMYHLTWVERIVALLLVETISLIAIVILPVWSSSAVTMVMRIVPLVSVIMRVIPIRSPIWIFIPTIIVMVIGVIREGAVWAIRTAMMVGVGWPVIVVMSATVPIVIAVIPGVVIIPCPFIGIVSSLPF